MTINLKESQAIFAAHYHIGNGLPGGVSFDIKLLVAGEDKSILGKGRICQAVNPPLNVVSDLNGSFNYQCTMRDCHIMVTLQGYQPYLGIPPLGADLHNVTLNILLNDDWKSGVAFYRYKNNSGEWIEVANQRVTLQLPEHVPSIEHLKVEKSDLAPA
ncbi:DUF1842 domain-containing protein [Vibrio sp. CCB-PB317]|uniref:DUF1842 domain-containing protein n=1 Tax=Vibrio sp. CCB-PB317 TaxID=2929171 RepID=UPI001FABF3B1|nr:DUF1842 domain-containing protein [Vibrio sp. CCB-PB317]MCJ0883051.1 DUF1842 domain-containing protein [Vibrio sp. CCB-PB317]